MHTPNLRITQRCLEQDLGLDSEWVLLDARGLVNEHAAIKKFVNQRGQDPSGGDSPHGPYPFGSVRSLHVSSARAVTAWDEGTDTCWLLAYNDYHRNGEPDDAYNVFNELYDRGELLPTEDDWYQALLADEDFVLHQFRESGERLLEQARREPGKEAFESFTDGGHQVICVDLVIATDGRAEQGWIGVTLPQDEHLSDDQVYDLVVQLLPDNSDAPLYDKTFKDRPARTGEIVYTWQYFDTVREANK